MFHLRIELCSSFADNFLQPDIQMLPGVAIKHSGIVGKNAIDDIYRQLGAEQREFIMDRTGVTHNALKKRVPVAGGVDGSPLLRQAPKTVKSRLC